MTLRGFKRVAVLVAAGAAFLTATQAFAATYVVTTTADSGPGSLRQAILDANANPGHDTIDFNVPVTDPGYNVVTQHWTIAPVGAALPHITDRVTIDGYTQPGASPNTQAVGNDAVLKIELAGTLATFDFRFFEAPSGLVVEGTGAAFTTIRGLAINRFAARGVVVYQTPDVMIEGNFIGTDVTGNLALANRDGGVWIRWDAPAPTRVIVGGSTPAQRNVISGNGTFGVALAGSDHQIVNNYIGTNAQGSAALGNNGNGIFAGWLGPAATSARIGFNVLSGNVQNGLEIVGGTDHLVYGNRIGTDATGSSALGNGSAGMALRGGVTVGGASPGEGNLVSGNVQQGIYLSYTPGLPVIRGNLIGTNAAGNAAVPNGSHGLHLQNASGTIVNNVVSGNREHGIFLAFPHAPPDAPVVLGNFVGTDASGTLALGNAHYGILATGARGARFGGAGVGEGNVISANGSVGLFLAFAHGQGYGSSGNTIQGNRIGAPEGGPASLGNGAGVLFQASAWSSTPDPEPNVLGGTSPGAGNLIAHNRGTGVTVDRDSRRDLIRSNSIFANAGLGIDLSTNSNTPDGPTLNDAGDPDESANRLQNYPLITSASAGGGSTTANWTFNSTPSTTFELEFFANSVCDPLAGEGETPLGTRTVTTDESGNASGTETFARTVAAPGGISATATDPASNTSEFSPCVAPAAVASANLSITKVDSADPITAGASVVYTLTVTNDGPSDAADVVVVDEVSPEGVIATVTSTQGTCIEAAMTFASCELGTLASGASATVTVTVESSVPGTITDRATVTSSTADPDPANNTDTETTQVNAPLAADLSVTKTDAPDPVVAGGTIDYTLTVRNNGPSDAQSVTLTDVVPAGTTFVSAFGPGWNCAMTSGTVTCTRTTLAAGTTAAVNLEVRVDPATPNGATITNTANVSASTPDPNAANNTDTETTEVNAIADLSVTKTDTPDPVTAGQNVTYTLTVRNHGPSDAQSVTLTDAVPAGTTFVSVSGAGWSCTTPPVGGTGAVTCTRPTLAAGATAPVSLVVAVNPATPGGAAITNTANVSASTPDANSANNTDTETTAVNARATDTTRPDCRVTILTANYIEVRMLDVGSGIASVNVDIKTNLAVRLPLFVPGTTSELVVTATRINRALPARLQLTVTDVAGNSVSCDPILTTLTVPTNGRPVMQTFRQLPQGESRITITNGTPGLSLVQVIANGRLWSVVLRPGQTRTLDVAAAMRPGDTNTITLIGYGRRGASADVTIADS